MTERRTENDPTGPSRRADMEGKKMSNTTVSKIVVPAEAIELVTGSLAPKNSVGQASIDFYKEALVQAGHDPESLTFAEVVEVTRRLYAPSADHRRSIAEVTRASKEAEREIARQKRDAEKTARLAKEKEAILAKLAKLETK